jgi:TPR repeat protein
MDKPRIHRQRTALLFVAAVATGLCFLPLGKVPLVWTMHGILTARKAALGLFALTAVVVLLGQRKKEMGLLLQIFSLAAAGALVGFCIFRIVVLGNRTMPTFEDDDPRAGIYYQKACDAGAMEACTMLGTCYWTGSCGLAKNGPRGFDLFQMACDGGEMGACGQLGVCYEFGGCGLTKSGERAVAYYEKACTGGEMSMCNNLGVCYHKGECGVGKDDARAAGLYKRACQGGDSGACHNLDLMKN